MNSQTDEKQLIRPYATSPDQLGDIYYAMNRKREAKHFWQQALELAEPEDEIEEDVRSKLDKLDAG